MEKKEIKHAYWIHAKIPSEQFVNGFYYSRQCTCSNCGCECNVEKDVCPECDAVMDQKPKEEN